MIRFTRLPLPLALWIGALLTLTAKGADLEVFEFNDTSGTTLGAAANSVNAANLWLADPEMAPSDVRSGAYNIVKASTALEASFLQIANVTSGSVWYTARMSGWTFSNFVAAQPEQFRISFLNDDDADFGTTITAEARIERNTTTGNFEVTGRALGVGSSNILPTAAVGTSQTAPFTLSVKVDANSDAYTVYYKDGANPTQTLGRGLVAPTRSANSIRMVAFNNFGDGSFDYPFAFEEVFSVDRIAVSDTSPFSDLLTLEVNRTTGAMTLRNTSGASISGWEGLTISSASGSLNPSGWDPVGTTTTSSTRSLLSETFTAQSLATNAQVVLSTAAGAWFKSPLEDVSAELTLTGGAKRTVDVAFVGNGGVRFATGDFDFNGAVSAADYLVLAANAETSLTGLTQAERYRRGDVDGDGVNSITDFTQFKTLFEAANGGGSFAQMLASIPEPGSAALAAVGLLLAAPSRRRGRRLLHRSLPSNDTPRQSHRMKPVTRCSAIVATCLGCLLTVAPYKTEAAILEDFGFSEAAGTTLDAVANSARPGNNWFTSATLTGTATTGGGALRINNGGTALESNFLDIVNITTGRAWLVVEINGWNLNTDNTNAANFDPANLEQVRFAFLNNDTAPTFGSTLSGQFQINRTSTGQVEMVGNNAGTGATNIAGSVALSNVRNTPFTVALELNATDGSEAYSVYYRDGTMPFQLFGTGAVAPGRNGNAIRFAISDNFSGSGEFFDINRVYLTDTNPIGAVTPIALTLEVNSTTGTVAIQNETAAAVSLDAYRITSSGSRLDLSRWNSLSDQGIDPVTGGNDPGETWDEAGGSSDAVLSESFLLGQTTIAVGGQLNLGRVFRTGGAQDLAFQYRDTVTGQLVTVTPTYVTGGALTGDYNNDGFVNAADYTVWRDTLGQTGPGLPADGNGDSSVNNADLTVWQTNYGASAPSTATAIPEPASGALIVLMAGAVVAGRHRA